MTISSKQQPRRWGKTFSRMLLLVYNILVATALVMFWSFIISIGTDFGGKEEVEEADAGIEEVYIPSEQQEEEEGTPEQLLADAQDAINRANYSEAMSLLEKAAGQGSSEAAVLLAEHYIVGRGTSPDYSEAAGILIPLAKEGNTRAQELLGRMYYDGGHGLLRDFNMAFTWYSKAARSNSPSSQYLVGLMYYHGVGTEQNLPQAEFWFRKAAQNGHQQAKTALSQLESAESVKNEAPVPRQDENYQPYQEFEPPPNEEQMHPPPVQPDDPLLPPDPLE
jgi:hypothetical protein